MTLANKAQKLYKIDPIEVEVWDFYGNRIENEEGYETQEVYNKEEAMRLVRLRRTELLLASDWTQMPDVVMSEAMKQKWQEYRQALRDYPATVNQDEWSGIAWPSVPVEDVI